MSGSESDRPSTRHVPLRAFWGRLFAVTLLIAAVQAGPQGATAADSGYGIAMHGNPALPPDFQHMPYANPNAPKGGGFAGV